jgi:hypothetical protein
VLRLVAVGVFVGALSLAPAAAARAPDCATKGHTIVANEKARVYGVGDEFNRRFYGCVYGSQRRKFLGEDVCCSSSGEISTEFFRLRGRRVGYANVDRPGEGVTAWDAKVVDLRSRKVTRHSDADGGLDDLRMTGSGSLALLSDDGATRIDGHGNVNKPHAYTVAKLERDGRTPRDWGKDIDPDSLVVARHRVYWTRAGTPRSAPID